MTVEEAYKFAEKPLKCEEASAELKEFCAIARGAIFRQIARKPTGENCPICGNGRLITYQIMTGKTTHFEFCPSCGQKLDWSNDDDH